MRIATAFFFPVIFFASTGYAQTEAKFSYDDATGKCVNSEGLEGYNPVDVSYLFGDAKIITETIKNEGEGISTWWDLEWIEYVGKDAECVDFRNFDFNARIGVQYSVLREWNLKGANFAGAHFNFNHMVNVDLRGAQLELLSFGYSVICGKVDSFTSLPPHVLSQPIQDGRMAHVIGCFADNNYNIVQ